jgi:Zn-dependent protease
MGADILLGRIAGVDVAASWSLLVILGLITWTPGAGVLPVAAPGTSAAAVWATAAVTAVAFFACLVAHELGHAVVARLAGMRVDGSALRMFGGVSRLAGDEPDARTEQRVAVAGPLTRAGLGVGLIAIAVLTDVARAPDVIVAATAWLGFMNGLLALINLLPAYPLDGGRMLRAIVWRRTGARRPAPGHGDRRDDRGGVRLRARRPRGIRGAVRGGAQQRVAGAARVDRAQRRPGRGGRGRAAQPDGGRQRRGRDDT